MNQQQHGLMPIGTFAIASHLSLKALRLYDQLGLLKPSYVDQDSGYRYYHADQLHIARQIRMLRQMEMPLATIRQMLAAPHAEAETLLRAYWRSREEWMEQARQMVHEFVAYLRHEEGTMGIEVTVKTVEPQPIVSLTHRVKVDQLDSTIAASVQRLVALADAAGTRSAGPAFGIFHGPINQDDTGPLEVCLPVEGAMAPTGDMAARTLAGGTVASVTMHGDQCEFPDILKGYDAVFDWVRQNGYEMTEPPREIWHSPPGADAKMEIALPFR
jgi:DNA-binding transcriptional MerR regulator